MIRLPSNIVFFLPLLMTTSAEAPRDLDEMDTAVRTKTYIEEGKGVHVDADDAVRAWLQLQEEEMKQD